MLEVLFYPILLLSLFLLELIYFKLADRYNIIDKPNHRSSHSEITIRGGGIIFPVSVLLGIAFFGYHYAYFLIGLLAISALSLTDDIKGLSSNLRSAIQLLAVAVMMVDLAIPLGWYWLLIILFLIVASINAYNFMDGINGITGGYSTITMASLLVVNFYVPFVNENLLGTVLMGLLVFNFFNFRKKARCFAGDVGSVSIAFIICFLIIKLIITSQNYLFIAFLLVYGLDAVTTILFRLLRKEKISEAHRSHFYQYLANEKKWPHLQVTLLYCFMQLLINGLIIKLVLLQTNTSGLSYLIALLLISATLFIVLRFSTEGKNRLLVSNP